MKDDCQLLRKDSAPCCLYGDVSSVVLQAEYSYAWRGMELIPMDCTAAVGMLWGNNSFLKHDYMLCYEADVEQFIPGRAYASPAIKLTFRDFHSV
jgi:hypothetical protein